jgi:glycerophosphoryl diester phosphodiesterase
MIKEFVTTASLGAILLLSAPDTSEAATIGIAPTGVTTVEVTAPLGALGLSGVPFGTATASGAVFSFPITGGTIDTGTGNALIEHEGSGVTLSNGSVNVSVGNFLIDTMMGTVSGNVIGAPGSVTFFTFGAPGATGIPLLISSELAGKLQSIFTGAPNLTDAPFGLANTSPTPVPVPAALPLLLAGLGGLALMRRKRAA